MAKHRSLGSIHFVHHAQSVLILAFDKEVSDRETFSCVDKKAISYFAAKSVEKSSRLLLENHHVLKHMYHSWII